MTQIDSLLPKVISLGKFIENNGFHSANDFPNSLHGIVGLLGLASGIVLNKYFKFSAKESLIWPLLLIPCGYIVDRIFDTNLYATIFIIMHSSGIMVSSAIRENYSQEQ